jgi:Ring finger domain
MLSASSSSSSRVPETLLALAKDERYLRKCRVIVAKAFDSASAGWLTLEGLSASGVTLLLYALLVVRRNHRTFGMEFLGLTTSKRNALWVSMAMAGLLNVALDTLIVPRDKHDLRGTARIRFHHEQRRAMLARSGDAPTTIAPSPTPTHWKRVKAMLRTTLLEWSSETTPGPHALPGAPLTGATWAMKLHLAYYCYTGRWPSLLHRLAGISEFSSTRSDVIATPPPNSHRVVAMMIGLQAMGGICRYIANQAAERIWATQPSSPAAASLPMVEEPSKAVTMTACCFICQLPRVSSAASSTCGHVFCWKCLYQWTARQQECPLCRTACRPQDIIALYNYEPTS